MQKYFNFVQDRKGTAVSGASVRVTQYVGGALATIYSDNGVTTVANPLTTDDNGKFAFYAADGRYTITITKSGAGGITTQTLSDVLIEDPATATDILYTATGTGAVARTLPSKLGDFLSVKDFGAVGDGVTDDTAAFNAAIAAAAGLLPVYMLAGTYKVSSLDALPANTRIFGGNWKTTVIKTTSATADVFTVDANYCILDGFSIESSVTRSAGSFVNLGANGDYFLAHGIRTVGAFVGFTLGNAYDVRLDHCRILDCVATTGNGVIVNYTFALHITHSLFDAPVGSKPANHIKINECGDCNISDCQIIRGVNGILACPGNGQEADAINITSTYLDSCGTHGFSGVPTGSGKIYRGKFVSVWASSAGTNGINLVSAGSTAIDGLSFTACDLYGCGGAGIALDGANVKNTLINGCQMGGDVYGIYINDSVDVTVSCSRIGTTSGFGANTTGINMSGACDRINWSGNNFAGNTTAAVWTTSGLDINWSCNMGYSGWKAYTVTPTAATGTFTTVAGAGTYLKNGKLAQVQLSVTVTTVGTAATAVEATLPFTGAAKVFMWAGRENAATGVMLQGYIQSSATKVSITKYDNAFQGSDGNVLYMSGAYEIA